MVESPLASNTKGTGEHKTIPKRPRQAGGKGRRNSGWQPAPVILCHRESCNNKMYNEILVNQTFDNQSFSECNQCEFRKVTKTNCSVPVENCFFEIETNKGYIPPRRFLTSKASDSMKGWLQSFDVPEACSVEVINKLKVVGDNTIENIGACMNNKVKVTKSSCVSVGDCDFEVVKGVQPHQTQQKSRLSISGAFPLKQLMNV
jgi:hypothetical protein